MPSPATEKKRLSWFAAIGPGILVAATGVGAGDLATATLAGAKLGTAVLWAVLVGAVIKYILNEGLTRWQLATNTTILEGTATHIPKAVQWLFLGYLFVWSYLVAMALMSACGVAAVAIFPFFSDDTTGKIVFGIAHSVLACVLVLLGGYKLFEKIMSLCIGVMFLVVVITAIALSPGFLPVLYGAAIPTIPQLFDGGVGWTIALLGGVGGTVTVLCYGYWIRESGRNSIAELNVCRIDLAVGYTMTAIFGLSMVVIGSQLGELDAKGATLIVEVARTLEDRLGGWGFAGKWAFLIGAWGAVFSSLLGVWQSVPYLFADFWRLQLGEHETKVDSTTTVYRVHLAALAVVPVSGLFLFNFATAMKVNGVVGALFIPMLAGVLLWLNSNASLVGKENTNRAVTKISLIIALLIFVFAGSLQILKVFSG
ncbi:MAG: Nramp family divalent metal transporter [Planctomycetota bacterium]